jgi:hypothetical protein
VFPGYRFFGAEGGLGDGVLRRIPGDSAQVQLFDSGGVGGSKEGAYVIKAADIVEQYANRQWRNAIVLCRLGSSAIGQAFQTEFLS